MSTVLSEFEGFEYTTKRGPARQLNFLVRVQQSQSEPTPALSSSEHQNYLWAGAMDSLEELPMSEGMRTVVRNAFRALGEY
jgi:hypothetical protein